MACEQSAWTSLHCFFFRCRCFFSFSSFVFGSPCQKTVWGTRYWPSPFWCAWPPSLFKCCSNTSHDNYDWSNHQTCDRARLDGIRLVRIILYIPVRVWRFQVYLSVEFTTCCSCETDVYEQKRAFFLLPPVFFLPNIFLRTCTQVRHDCTQVHGEKRSSKLAKSISVQFRADKPLICQLEKRYTRATSQILLRRKPCACMRSLSRQGLLDGFSVKSIYAKFSKEPHGPWMPCNHFCIHLKR